MPRSRLASRRLAVSTASRVSLVASVIAMAWVSEPAHGWQTRLGSGAGGVATSAVVMPGGDVVAYGGLSIAGQGNALTIVRLSGRDGTERWQRVFADESPNGLAPI